jgi:hypothetical protein
MAGKPAFRATPLQAADEAYVGVEALPKSAD